MIKEPKKIFVTGIGTGIGKTVISAILVEALQADYWKPVQAGFADGSDSEWISSVISNKRSTIHPEKYRLQLGASPHIAAREEHLRIDLKSIFDALPKTNGTLIIEGAGGLMVPLNEREFVADLVKQLNVPALLVSRNYLGSINHSLLTAIVCRQKNIDVLGWVFNDHYLDYETEIANWSGLPVIASIPFYERPGKAFVSEQAQLLRKKLGI